MYCTPEPDQAAAGNEIFLLIDEKKTPFTMDREVLLS
jgi:hypothetical protein